MVDYVLRNMSAEARAAALASIERASPKHDPKTMSYAAGKTEPIKTDRGEFAFRKNGERK